VGPRVGMDGRKISPPPGLHPRPARSQSLYRLSYPDLARYCLVKHVIEETVEGREEEKEDQRNK